MAILSKNTKIGNKKPLLIADNIKSKNIDLNDYTSEGVYIFKDLVTSSNFPKNYEWINNNPSHLQVFIFDNNNSSKVMQILTRYNCNNLFIRYLYINELNETVWTEWVIVGESVESSAAINNLQYYGDITIHSSDEQYFLVSDDGSSIIGLSDEGKTQTELVIPYKINNHYIKTIDDAAFKDNIVLSKVILPKSIISINNHAFDGCIELSYINFPNTVTNIGEYAFNNTNLINIVIPESVSYIDEYAFANCSNLINVEIPKSLINISSSALNNSNANLIIYCEQNSIAETFAKNNNYSIMYTDVNQLSHRNFALQSKNNIPADIRAGDICFIWNQFDSSHTTDDFKAANFTNMPISDDINTADTEYFGLVKGTTDGLISADMEVAKTPSGTKIFFNKI